MELHDRLDKWARWVFVGRGLSLDYPSVEPFAQMRGGGLPIAPISDDEGLYIDSLIAALSKDHPLESQAVCYFHLYAPSYRKLAKVLSHSTGEPVTREAAGRAYESGVMWIKGKIS